MTCDHFQFFPPIFRPRSHSIGSVLPMSSPYSNSRTNIGFYDHAHTSTVGIAYTPSTLPTPWPILSIGFLLSFLTALWGAVSNFLQYRSRSQESRPPRKSSGIFSPLLTVLATIITTIRSVSALIQAIRATQNGTNRPADIMALFALLISSSQYLFLNTVLNPYERLHIRILNNTMRSLAAFDIIFVLISGLIMFSLLIKGNSFYAKWTLVGGTCPTVVERCTQLSYVGCRISTFVGAARINAKYINTVNSANYLRLEQLLGGIFLIMVLFGTLPLFLRQRRILKRSGGNVERSPVFRTFLHFGACLSITMLAATAIPLAAVQETNPKAINIVDSFGAILPASSSNGSSWSDCFTITAPANKYGFLDIWWADRGSEIANLLSLT